MNARSLLSRCFVPALILSLTVLPALAQTVDPAEFSGLHWRMIGPFRAGRVVAVSGATGGGSTFYFGGVDGGVWKSTDAGTVWKPIFDHEPVASIGALAVAPSDPQVMYAGTGESDIRSDLASGDGVYRSDDGGAHWQSVGLADTQQISRILVDPRDPKTVYVGALGHAYGPNDERGVYKSTDGGSHWERVLDKGPDVGIADLAMATDKPKILFAATWNAHRSTWSTYAPLEGPGNGLWRSTDAGKHWTAITGHGLPTAVWGRAGVAVSADGRRVYATIAIDKTPAASGLYRSDDGGDSWKLVNTDPRLTSRAWYFNALAIDPQNPDVLYIPNVALYRTEDGGKTVQIVRGAPGGDDYHQVWVDPKDDNHLMLGVDQGASVSLDRGRTWTTWYNQPTAQLYHVTTDHRFPYVVYGAQQDSGSIAVSSRSDHGHIDTRDWFLPGGSESGYLALDPKDENIIYLSGTYGSVQRFDRRTSFGQNVAPWPVGSFEDPINQHRYRDPWTPVLVFSPADKTSLYLGTQYVMKTMDGGLIWKQISPDLTGGVTADAKATGTVTDANAITRGYGVVYTIAPSPLRAAEIWAGSDTGLIHLTTDGGLHWADVTPPGLSPWSKISLIEASHFDPATAYAAVDRHRLGDRRPYLYITHDYGRHWQLSVDGIPTPHFLRAVREDPKQRGLLYAGTEFGAYVSFNDGGHWQPLQLNLPVSSVRDLDVHDNDLVIATHGRSFWILDDITPLRQTAAVQQAASYLYRPETTVRVDNDGFLGTPLPPEEPQAENPPNGAIVDYYLGNSAQTVTLQILDSRGRVLRHFSSADKPVIHRPLLPIAERWFPVPQQLDTTAGEHRFIWDLSASGVGTGAADDDDDEAGMPPGPRVPPGMYTLRLAVDGHTMEKPLQVTMDPRSTATTVLLTQNFALASEMFAATETTRKAMAELQSVASELRRIAAGSDAQGSPALREALAGAQQKLNTIQSGPAQEAGNGEAKDADAGGLMAANQGLGVALRMTESSDRQPPSQARAIYAQMHEAAETEVAAWRRYKTDVLPALNKQLQGANLPAIQVAAIEEQVHYAMTR